MSDETPDWAKDLAEATSRAAEAIAKEMAEGSEVLHVQRAMGFMYQGDSEEACKALEWIPVARLAKVSAAASALAALAHDGALWGTPR